MSIGFKELVKIIDSITNFQEISKSTKFTLFNQMENQHQFKDDSMSLVVDDRFFGSQSPSVNEQREQMFQEINFSRQGISEMLIFNQKSFFTNEIRQKQPEKVTDTYQNSQIRQSAIKNINIPKSKTIQKHSEQSKPTRQKVMQKKKQNSKNYRQRKKQYFTTVQQQYQYYKKRTLQLQQKVRSLEAQICELKYDPQNQQISGYEKQFKTDIDFLKGKVTEGSLSDSELMNITLVLRQKYGPAGKDRKRVLNYYMSEYINNTMADCQKYIFTSALNKTGPFGEIKTKLDQKVQQLLNLSPEQKSNLKKSVLNQLYPAAITFKNSCNVIYKDYVKLLEQAEKFQKKMTFGFSFILVCQLTKLVSWFEQNRNRMQMRKLKDEWIETFSGENRNGELLQTG